MELVEPVPYIPAQATRQDRKRGEDRPSGFRNVPVKGDTILDIPLPTAVIQHLDRYVRQFRQYLPIDGDDSKPDTRLFWSAFGSGTTVSCGDPWKGACPRLRGAAV